MLKTVEMIEDFRRDPPALPPLTIMNSSVKTVESLRFMGTTISQDLKWDNHIDSIVFMDEHKNHDTVSAAAQRTEKQVRTEEK